MSQMHHWTNRVLSLNTSSIPVLPVHHYTVAPRYNAVVGVHEMEPRYKRGALYIIFHQGRHPKKNPPLQQPKPMCW